MRNQDVAKSTRETQKSLLARRQGSLAELPSRDHRPDAGLAVTGGRSAAACAWLLDFPEVRISTGRLDIPEFGPADADLVSEVLQGGSGFRCRPRW